MASWKRTFYAAWGAQICSITGFGFVLPFLALFVRDELGVADRGEAAWWAGIAGGAAAVTMAVFAPIWGVLADRYGRKPMVLRSMLGGAVVLALMSFTRTVGQLVACRLLQGCLTGTMTASVALVASVAPRERSGYALGMMGNAAFVGMSLGPFLGGVVAERAGFRPAFLAAGGLLFLGAVLVHFGVREEFTPPARSLTREERGTFGQVFLAVGFAAAVFTLLAVRFANSAARPVFALFVEQVKGSRAGVKELVGQISAVGAVSAAFWAWVLGRVSDAWGHKRLLVACSLVACAVALVHILVGRVWQFFALRAAFGMAAGGMQPAANAIIRNITHDRNIGKAYGVTSSLTAVGWAGGLLLGGYLGKTAGLRAPFVLMGGGFAFAAVLVAWRVRSGPPARAEEPGGPSA